MEEKQKDLFFKLDPDTQADFEEKELSIEDLKKLSETMSKEDKEIYYQAVARFEEPVNIIMQALRDKCKDPETSVIFINELNDVLRKNNVK